MPHEGLAVAVVGTGRLARVATRAFREAGHRVAVLSRSSEQWPEGLGGATVTTFDALATPLDAMLVAIPDGLLGSFDATSARADIITSRTIWLHGAGSLPPEALAANRQPAPLRATWHPLLSLPLEPPERFLVGATIAVVGEGAAREMALRLARDVHAEPVELAREDLAAYHAAATFIAGGIGALWSALPQLAPTAIPARGWRRLADSALANVQHAGVPAGLTGPATRGDLATLERNYRALPDDPALRALWRAFTGRLAEQTQQSAVVEWLRTIER